MKLSDAMRLGAAMRPRRIKNRLFDRDDGACAIGAAVIGCGIAMLDGRYANDYEQLVLNKFPWLKWSHLAEVVRLNDELGQSIEEICAFVDQFDPEALPAPVPAREREVVR